MLKDLSIKLHKFYPKIIILKILHILTLLIIIILIHILKTQHTNSNHSILIKIVIVILAVIIMVVYNLFMIYHIKSTIKVYYHKMEYYINMYKMKNKNKDNILDTKLDHKNMVMVK